MKTLKFKTNIKCSGCVAAVTPHLNETVGSNQWQVDINDPAKVLTVSGDITEEKVKDALKKVGYSAERIRE